MTRALPLCLFSVCISLTAAEYDKWNVAGGTSDNIHYSTLKQINRENVSKLKQAWAYDSGDAFDGSEMQCNPIVVNGVLYATSPKLRAFAIDAATGREIWTFNPNEEKARNRKARNRGLTYWAGEGKPRIYYAVRQFLYAIDAQTGKLAEEFGEKGRVDLREGLGRDAREVTISVTSPGVVYRDLLIVGSIVGESLPSAPGDIRAYDLRSGKLRWSFHTIPHPGEFGYDTWPKDGWKYLGGANNWSGMVVDQ